MSWLWALDTTHSLGSMALLRDGAVVDEVVMESSDGFSHILFTLLQEMLERQRVGFDEIVAFAAASGPGSFTGVRIGLAAVKGFAAAAEKPVFGVSNLEALASLGTGLLRAPYYDARRGDVYSALFDDKVRPLQPETVMPLEAWRAGLPDGAELIELRGPIAGAIGRRAWARYLAGERPRAEGLDANYVRRSDAEMHWREA